MLNVCRVSYDITYVLALFLMCFFWCTFLLGEQAKQLKKESIVLLGRNMFKQRLHSAAVRREPPRYEACKSQVKRQVYVSLVWWETILSKT